MIPIVEKIIQNCETKDKMSEIGLLAGLAVVLYGSYKVIKSQDEQMKHSGILATAVGGMFMLGSINLNNTSCRYRYQ